MIYCFFILSIAILATMAATAAATASQTCGRIGILGTGRMGTHLSATWSQFYEVVLGSRDKSKSESIVSALKSGKGYRGLQGEDVPPYDASGSRLTAGSLEEASECDIVVLVTPFPITADLIDSLRAKISGQNKIIIDMTNPWYSGSGLPAKGPQSAVEIHKAQLNDPTASWAIGYKPIMWNRILPGKRDVEVPVCGETLALAALTQIIEGHGFKAVNYGGLEAAASLEPGRR